MVVQVMLNHTVVDKAYKTVPGSIQVFLDLPVVLFQRLRKSHIKLEVWKFLLQFLEVVNIKEFPLGSPPVPIGYFPVGFQGFEEMVQVRTHRSHPCSPAHIEHFGVGLIDKEFPVRP